MRTKIRCWIILVLFCSFLPTSVAKAQILLLAKEHTGKITVGPGFFSSDMGRDGVFQIYNPRICIGLHYAYRMHDRWAIKVSTSYGFYGEKDGNFRPTRGWEVTTHLVDLTAAAQFYILKRNSGMRPDFYIAAGIGVLASINPTLSQPNFDPKKMQPLPEVGKTKQEVVDAWNANHAKKKKLSALENPKDLVRTDKKVLAAPTIPVSLGATWGIGKRFLLGIDYTFRISTSDYLDNLNPVGSWCPDIYSSLSFSVGYLLKTDCYTCQSALSKPKFKKTKASSGYWF